MVTLFAGITRGVSKSAKWPELLFGRIMGVYGTR